MHMNATFRDRIFRGTTVTMMQLAIFGLILGTLGTVSPAKAESLYDQFGQKAGITALVSTFFGNVAADRRINYYFAQTNIPALAAAFAAQLGQATGGPERYDGPNMREAHAGLGVTQEAFNAVVEDLMSAMNSRNIPISAQHALLAMLAPMERDIVTK